MNEIQHYFASYSKKDRRLVQPIVQILRSNAAAVFLDRDSIPPGDKWKEVLTDSLEIADTLLLFWSRDAKKSEWVTMEWNEAVRAGKRILPILVDETPLPKSLAAYQWIDFRYIGRKRRTMRQVVMVCIAVIILQFSMFPFISVLDLQSTQRYSELIIEIPFVGLRETWLLPESTLTLLIRSVLFAPYALLAVTLLVRRRRSRLTRDQMASEIDASLGTR